MLRRRGALSVAALSIFFLAACRSPEPLSARLAGCQDMDASGRCFAEPGAPLTVLADGALTVRVDGALAEATFPAPDHPAEVVVRAGKAQAVLRVAPPPEVRLPPPAEDPAEELAQLAAAPHEGLAGVLGAWRTGHAHRQRGEAREAATAFTRSAALARAQGLVSHEVRARAMAALAYLDALDLAKAEAAISGMPAETTRWPEGEVLRAHHAGVVARSLGDLRGAGAAFQQAIVLGTRIHSPVVRFSQHERAMTWIEGGRLDAAQAALQGLAVPEDGDCERAALESNLAWVELLRRERGSTPGPDPVPHLTTALSVYAGPCAYPQGRDQVLLNLAIAAEQAGDVAEAGRWLARTPTTAPDLTAWRLELTARLAARRGAWGEARAAYEALDAEGVARMQVEPRWRAAVGLGRVLEAEGRADAAVAALRRAEALLVDDSLRVPLDQGRLGFLLDREQSARRLVGLLLRLGRSGDALEAARRARRRALVSVAPFERAARLSSEQRAAWADAFGAYRQAQERWSRRRQRAWQRTEGERAAAEAEDEALARGVKEALDRAMTALGAAAPSPTQDGLPALARPSLAWFPTDAGWAAFLADEGGVEPAAGPKLAPLLERWRARLAASPRVRLLGQGLADLPGWLAARGVWALDLPPRGAPQLRRATVVADPERNLPFTREEASAVEARLRKPIEVGHIAGREVTREAMGRALSTADLLHYAGHAQFAGVDGWDSHLPLGDGTALSVGEILTAPRVPPVVVLSGCETARATDGQSAGLGLGQAFVAAGAAVVVAAPRPVADADAARFMAALYEAYAASGDFTKAFLATRARAPEVGFVLLEP